MSEDIERIDWEAIRGLVCAPEPAAARTAAPAPSRTKYHREYQRRRRGYVGRTYAIWPADLPEGKRENLRRQARARGVPVEIVQREWGNLGMMDGTRKDDDIPRFDWPAIKAMVEAPAYFARVLESSRGSSLDRGLDAAELDLKTQAGRLNGARNRACRVPR